MTSPTLLRRRVLPALFLLTTFLSTALAQRERGKVEIPTDVDVVTGVEFGQGGGRALKLNIIRPKTIPSEPMPVVVYIHGGGWQNGSAERGIGQLAGFARRGYFGASIEYRLSDEATFPAQIEDAKCAIRFLRAKAAEYNLDPDRIGVWGGSAGGHLAALLGTSGGIKELEGSGGHATFSSRVQAVCDWFGPADLALMLEPSSPKAVAKMLGGTPAKIKEHVAAASPITHVSKDDPPFLIMHGDQDPVVPFRQSVLMHEALKKAGVESTLHIIAGAGHGLRGDEHVKMAADFLDRHLKSGSAAKTRSD